MSSLLRTYNGSNLDSVDLPFSRFQEIVDSWEGKKDLFLLAYSGRAQTCRLTYEDFYRKVLTFSSHLLKDQGQLVGEAVAVAMENTPEALIVFSALMYLGCTVIPLDPGQKGEYYEKSLTAFKFKALIAHSDHVSAKLPIRFYSYQETKDSPVQFTAGKSFSVVFASSGTTGTPKGIIQTFKSLMVNAVANMRVHSLKPSTVHFCFLPLFHANAFNFSFFTTLVSGNILVLNKNFHQQSFWDVVAETKTEIVSAIPPVLRILVEDNRPVKAPASLRYIVCAASHLSKRTIETFHAKFNLVVLQGYGLTETVCFSTFCSLAPTREDYLDSLALNEKTSIGTEVWGNHVYLLDETGERITEEFTKGELAIRGWNLMEGYFNAEEMTNDAFAGDYFHTGDIGYFRLINGEKHYYLSGRKREIAKVKGRLVHLNDIDELVMELSYIIDSCAVCYLDKNQEEQIGIYLILKEVRPIEEIRADIRELMPKGFNLGEVITGTQIFLTPSGKKQRGKMSSLYFDRTEGTK